MKRQGKSLFSQLLRYKPAILTFFRIVDSIFVTQNLQLIFIPREKFQSWVTIQLNLGGKDPIVSLK